MIRNPRRKERRPRDNYPTPSAAVLPLIPFLERDGIGVYAEPCAGEGKLIGHLGKFGLSCCLATDIEDGIDARFLRVEDLNPDVVDAVITNPPYEQPLMFEILDHLLTIFDGPIWLLLEAPLMHNISSKPYINQHCTDIVSIGRVNLIEGTTEWSTYDFCWYRFQHGRGGPRFHACAQSRSGNAVDARHQEGRRAPLLRASVD